MLRRGFASGSGGFREHCPKWPTEQVDNSSQTSGHKLRSGPIRTQHLGHPEGTQHPGVLFLGYFLLDKQKKVTCRGSATHAVFAVKRNFKFVIGIE